MKVLYFDPDQKLLLLAGSIFLLISVFLQIKNRQTGAIIFLTIASFFFFCFAALLDPFLNLWDERFHALVGKNLMAHPLMPTLYNDPVVDMAYDRWDRYHIWLHKQPLFLWQIALSFKIFGVSEFSLRLPSVILASFFVFITFRTALLLVNPRAGYFSAIIIFSTLYLLELVAGRQELEHNDISFVVYVSASIWAWIEYNYSKKRFWIFFIGLFSGFAILCKWVVGLLVYLGWLILKIQNRNFKLSNYTDFGIALLVTLIIAAPWQFLIFTWYPREAAFTYQMNVAHFNEALEGHRGNFWYHFDQFNQIYGAVASFLIIPAWIVLFRKTTDRKIFFSLAGMTLFVFLFFSVAATKMPSFTLVVSMMIFIAFGALMDQIIKFVQDLFKQALIKEMHLALSVIGLFLLRFDTDYLAKKYTTRCESNVYSEMMIHNKEVFLSLNLPENTVLFNVKGRHYIEAMFYTGLPAYNFVPSYEQSLDLKAKGRLLAVFHYGEMELPEYLLDDKSIVFIKEETKGYQ